MDELQKYPVGITVHHALERAVNVIADRVGVFLGLNIKLGRIRNQLPRDRIIRIGRVDELRHFRSERHGVARRDGVKSGQPFGVNYARLGQVRNIVQVSRHSFHAASLCC